MQKFNTVNIQFEAEAHISLKRYSGEISVTEGATRESVNISGMGKKRLEKAVWEYVEDYRWKHHDSDSERVDTINFLKEKIAMIERAIQVQVENFDSKSLKEEYAPAE
jgi:ABC-type antimicrobial peptide transport system ATPase subunit